MRDGRSRLRFCFFLRFCSVRFRRALSVGAARGRRPGVCRGRTGAAGLRGDVGSAGYGVNRMARGGGAGGGLPGRPGSADPREARAGARLRDGHRRPRGGGPRRQGRPLDRSTGSPAAPRPEPPPERLGAVDRRLRRAGGRAHLEGQGDPPRPRRRRPREPRRTPPLRRRCRRPLPRRPRRAPRRYDPRSPRPLFFHHRRRQTGRHHRLRKARTHRLRRLPPGPRRVRLGAAPLPSRRRPLRHRPREAFVEDFLNSCLS
mmetsp:Transcript_15996/g.52094  ORF Transcript_15996/g.52094 Transcript_15996/m.52094 type:complete len:259 (-) Transcript_15996:133-909(-)